MNYSCKCSDLLDDVCDQCSPDCSEFSLESCCCCHCDNKPRRPLVKGKFGLAYVVETPKKKYSKPLGWQIEFEDTPSRIVNNCKKMMKWVNCPPLGDCKNQKTNFCVYPDNCGEMFSDRNERRRSPARAPKPCECVQDEVKLCYVKKGKKKSRSPVRDLEQHSCSPNHERVCIFCENCKINATRCWKQPTVTCYCGNSKKCSAQPTHSKNFKCCCDCVLEKDDSSEQCCKCCRSKNQNDFFQGCCSKTRKNKPKKNCHPTDESLDYIPKKEDNKNSQKRETEKNTNHVVKQKPVSKENKGTKMDFPSTDSKQINTKPFVDELKEKLNERKETESETTTVPKTKEEIANTNEVVVASNLNSEHDQTELTSLEQNDTSKTETPGLTDEKEENISLLQKIKRAHQKQMDEIHHDIK